MAKNKPQKVNKRKGWFEVVKKIMRLAIKPSKFEYLGEEVQEGAIIVSNHVGTAAPLAWELYGNKPIRFWGAHEMNSGLIKMYKYQTRVFYHEKKHWNLHLARLFCLIASPLTNMFYKGLNLISVYKDSRLAITYKQSIEAINQGQNLVIFPEDSTKGYLDELEGFHKGFLSFARVLYKKGIDAPVYVAYYKKAERRYVIDKPVKLSELFAETSDLNVLANKLCTRCNELGKM